MKEEKREVTKSIYDAIGFISGYLRDIDYDELDGGLQCDLDVCKSVFAHMEFYSSEYQIDFCFVVYEFCCIRDELFTYLDYVYAYIGVLLQTDRISSWKFDFYLAGINEFRAFVRENEDECLADEE